MPKGVSSGKKGGSANFKAGSGFSDNISLRNVTVTPQGVFTEQEIRKGSVIIEEINNDILNQFKQGLNSNVELKGNNLVASQTIRKDKEIITPSKNSLPIAKRILSQMKDIEYDQFTDEESYKVRNPEQVFGDKKGVCYDQVELQQELMKKEGVKTKKLAFYIDPVEDNPTHTVLVFQDRGRWKWMENSWNTQRGIHGSYENEIEAAKDIESRLRSFWKKQDSRVTNNTKINIIEYDKVKYGKNLNEFMSDIKRNKVKDITLSNISQPPKIVYNASKLQTDTNTQTQKNNVTEGNVGSNKRIRKVYAQSDEETIAQWTNEYTPYYGRINARLRKGKELTDIQKARVNKLKEVLSRTPEYSDIVYKGLDFNKKEYEAFVYQIERGKISFPAFSGATKYKEYPKEFLERFTLRSRNRHVLLTIKNPKANDIKDFVGRSKFGDEGEVILSPSEYYVEHVDWKKNKTGIRADVTINSKNPKKNTLNNKSTIIFPKEEHDLYKNEFSTQGETSTLRMLKEYDKYKVGKVYRTEWNQKVRVTSSEKFKNIREVIKKYPQYHSILQSDLMKERKKEFEEYRNTPVERLTLSSYIPLKRSTLPSAALKNSSNRITLPQKNNVLKPNLRSSIGKEKVTTTEFNKFAQSEHIKALKNIEKKLGVKINVPLKVMKNPSVYTDGTPVPSTSKFSLGQGSAAVQAKNPFITVGTEQSIIDVTKQTRKELGDKNWNKKVGVKSMVKYVVQHENLHHVYPQLTESQKKRVYQYIKANNLLTEYGQRSRREEGVIDAFTNLLLRKDLREGEFKKLKKEEIQKHLLEMKKIIKK